MFAIARSVLRVSTGFLIRWEVVKLNSGDINFATYSVIIHGKGNKEKEVYFNVKVRARSKKHWVIGKWCGIVRGNYSIIPYNAIHKKT